MASTTSASACQWSPCWWVVTTRANLGAYRSISSSRTGASFAASTSSASPDWEHVIKYALLSMGPTDALTMVAPGRVRRAAEPGATWPV